MSHPGLESSLSGFFAAFLSAAGKADAHWYSVKSLSEGVPSLAGLLGISNDNLDKILSLSGFGRIPKGGGLLFLADKFKNFLVLSDTQGFCEHTMFKVKGFKKTKTILYRNQSLAIMRHLAMSVTPKDHCIEDHAVQLMFLHEGIGDLKEDQGEQNHQLESKEDLRLGGVRSFQRREAFKSKQDGKKHDPGVKEKITKMYDKNAKRKNAEETAARHAEKRLKRMSAREEALLFPAPEGVMETLRRLRKNKLANNA